MRRPTEVRNPRKLALYRAGWRPLAVLCSIAMLPGVVAPPVEAARPAAPLPHSVPLASGQVIAIPSPGNHHDLAPSLQAAVNAASPGDTLLLPAGEFYLDGRVVVDKFIKIIGRGRGDNGTTLYRREQVSDEQLESWKAMLDFRCYSDTSSGIVLTDIHFKGREPSYRLGDGKSNAMDIGVWMKRCVDFVIARNRFEGFGHAAVAVFHKDTLARGLITSNDFYQNMKINPDTGIFRLGYGVVVGGEDAAWIPDPGFGSDNFIFIEDNAFREQRHAVAGAGTARYVFRNNRVIDNFPAQAIDAHGGGNYGNTLSTRAVEAYGNEITNTRFKDGTPMTDTPPHGTCSDLSYVAVTLRGGESLIYDNRIQGYRFGVRLTTEITGTYPVITQIGYLSGVNLGPSHRGSNPPASDGDVFMWDNAITFYDNSSCLGELVNGQQSLLVEGRDYHLGTSKAGYTPYVYPHPLRAMIPGPDPSRPSVQVKRAATPITIDGRLLEYPAPADIQFNDDSGRGVRDNSTSVFLLWDPTYLHLAVQVDDTQLQAGVTTADGPVWRDDALEVFLDPQADGGIRFGADDYRVAVNLLATVADSRGSWEGHQAWDGAAAYQIRNAGTLNDDSDLDQSYSLEIAIPWTDLGISPAEGAQLGLDVAVDDRDDLADGYQYSDWIGLGDFNQPWRWGLLTLSGEAAGGSTFADVPADHPYHDEIEALYQAGYTAGCGANPLRYCPDQAMSRAESAVFVQRGAHGVDLQPAQPAGQTFADLPLESWAAKWAEALYVDGFTVGCGVDPLRFCPWQGHTRAEGATFYLRMLHGADYIPPEPEGIFSDVPPGAWHAKWDEAAYNAGLIPACGQPGEPLRFCPDDPLSRGLAAFMMVRAKGLAPP